MISRSCSELMCGGINEGIALFVREWEFEGMLHIFKMSGRQKVFFSVEAAISPDEISDFPRHQKNLIHCRCQDAYEAQLYNLDYTE